MRAPIEAMIKSNRLRSEESVTTTVVRVSAVAFKWPQLHQSGLGRTANPNLDLGSGRNNVRVTNYQNKKITTHTHSQYSTCIL